ncbi:methylcrotonoyl-CoA carboxylase beta chain, mitochondrial [Trichonephila inaurata madagascariensis]|uniref:methylcrotonoyl-CoA carboxylase n=1 Tax=Trichonephila inaurata madagascariensis TaxID=2747483 RepID=A0A8X6XJG5_9ARAC|nr:methylcrotonoyl-CoA carboxylase beta chain, mitochondrial [Trichonephila inaurata madagascariensis]
MVLFFHEEWLPSPKERNINLRKDAASTTENKHRNSLFGFRNDIIQGSTLLKCMHLKSSFRSLSFKVLSYEIDYEKPESLTAEKNAKQTKQILTYLSEFAKAGGGAKGIHRHTVKNKKILVRDRLKLLFDPDSPFLEIGLFAGLFMDYGTIPTAGIVTGIGKIHGQFCIVGANDATVKGGTFYPITVTKQIRLQQLALLNRLTCIYLVDSGGAFLPLQADIFPDSNHGGRVFYNETVMSSLHIPQIAVVCGSSTAGGAYCPTMAEEAIIVKQSGVIFLGGPPLVKAATGEIVSEQDLGGALMHCSVSGCTDYFAENEEEAFEMCRESVLTLNLHQYSKPTSYKEPLYSQKDLLLISGKNHLFKEDMYVILSRILDGSMFKEFKTKFGSNLITGFGFIHG